MIKWLFKKNAGMRQKIVWVQEEGAF